MQAVDELKQNIASGELKRLYYICGEEKYLKRYWLGEIIKTMFGDDGTSAPDCHKLDGEDVAGVSEFADLLEAVPVFAPRKLIVIVDSAVNSEYCSYLIRNRESLGDDTVLVFYGYTEPFDERLKDFKEIKKIIDDVGLYVKIDRPDAAILEKWTSQRFRNAGIEADSRVIRYFLSQTDNDMDSLSNEIAKLTSFCDEKLTTEAIDTITIKTAEAKTYELVDAVLDKNMDSAYSILSTLYSMKTGDIILLTSIFSAICNLYKTKIYLGAGLSYDDIAKKTGMRDFVVKRYAARLSKISFKTLSALIDKCCEADIATKSSSVDSEVIITTLIAETAAII